MCLFVPKLMTAELSLREVAALFDDIRAELSVERNGDSVMDLLAQLAVRRVDGAEYAGVTVGREGGHFTTPAATDSIVHACDQIQYDLGTGPCVDAVLTHTTHNVADLRTDERWPEFGRRCFDKTGIVSMLSMRFYVESDRSLVAGLNMYSHRPAAFDEDSEAMAHLLATHGAMAVGKATAENKARNPERALQTSREIGTAIGIVMSQHKVTADQAFDLLRVASQRGHRKLADIAIDVAETGALPRAMDERA